MEGRNFVKIAVPIVGALLLVPIRQLVAAFGMDGYMVLGGFVAAGGVLYLVIVKKKGG